MNIPKSSPLALDILENAPWKDVDAIKFCISEVFVTDKVMRLFVCYCATTALSFVEKPDPRSINAVKIAELYAHGKATKIELAAAHAAAYAAAEKEQRKAFAQIIAEELYGT